MELLPDLSKFNEKQASEEIYHKAYANEKPKAAENRLNQVWNFAKVMKKIGEIMLRYP